MDFEFRVSLVPSFNLEGDEGISALFSGPWGKWPAVTRGSNKYLNDVYLHVDMVL